MMDEDRIISKRDIIFIMILLIALSLVILIIHFNKRTGYYVTLSADGDVIETFSLDDDMEYRFETEAGFNVIVIEDGQVYVREADCRDKICVNHSRISNVGETIICLPHKLVIEITE
ncbi:MAG: NusG domain II-containing protein [Lachnospiraceae bacterium]|nr:NusG domain II-containing protein [Lachnospiraceae bacterium]